MYHMFGLMKQSMLKTSHDKHTYVFDGSVTCYAFTFSTEGFLHEQRGYTGKFPLAETVF